MNALVEDIRKIVQYELSDANRHLLSRLCKFLAGVSAQGSINMMTPSNLSICIAPNIMRPKVTQYIHGCTLNGGVFIGGDN